MIWTVCAWCKERPRWHPRRWFRLLSLRRWWPLFPIRISHGQCRPCQARVRATWRAERGKKIPVSYPRHGAGER